MLYAYLISFDIQACILELGLLLQHLGHHSGLHIRVGLNTYVSA